MKLASPVNAGDNLWRMTGSLSGLSKSCKTTFKDWGARWRNSIHCGVSGGTSWVSVCRYVKTFLIQCCKLSTGISASACQEYISKCYAHHASFKNAILREVFGAKKVKPIKRVTLMNLILPIKSFLFQKWCTLNKWKAMGNFLKKQYWIKRCEVKE